MSVEAVKRHLRRWGKDEGVLELAESCATVDLAARAVGVCAERIAKTLSFAARKEEGSDPERACILVVASGDARIDGKKFKDRFGVKSKMLAPDEALARTGHGVGGVCPFAVDNPEAAIYLDLSLRRFTTVYPACGSANSLIELSCEDLYAISGARAWVDVCRDWRPDAATGENS